MVKKKPSKKTRRVNKKPSDFICKKRRRKPDWNFCLPTFPVDAELISQGPVGFEAHVRPLTQPIVISLYKPYESKLKFYLKLSNEEIDLFNGRCEHCLVQILLRVGKDIDNEIYWDKVPTDLMLKINHSLVGCVSSPFSLEKVFRKWPSNNKVLIQFSWYPMISHSYVVQTDFIIVWNPSLIRDFLGTNVRSSSYTIDKISEIISGNIEDTCQVLSQEVSLLCPLTLTKMKVPVQGSLCNHIRCFDAENYLEMNRIKPRWTCPICGKLAYPQNLIIDGYFLNVLNNCTRNSVYISSDGPWTTAYEPEPAIIVI